MEIEKTWRVLPIGYWKGSGLAIALDLIAAVLSGGKSTYEVGENGSDEYSLSQVVIAIDPFILGDAKTIQKVLDETVDNIKASLPINEGGKIFYPGELEMETRAYNLKNGIPVDEKVWDKIMSL